MLHLYESFGWWRGPELRKVHNAEEWNELHHLLIMESLGGNALWSDRFLGYHVAFAYYWFLNAVYLCSPRIAYQFMELLEAHAVDTYTTFVAENRDRLAQLPPPSIARNYYKDGDLYQFDDFQVCPIAPLQGSRLARSPSAQDPAATSSLSRNLHGSARAVRARRSLAYLAHAGQRVTRCWTCSATLLSTRASTSRPCRRARIMRCSATSSFRRMPPTGRRTKETKILLHARSAASCGSSGQRMSTLSLPQRHHDLCLRRGHSPAAAMREVARQRAATRDREQRAPWNSISSKSPLRSVLASALTS